MPATATAPTTAPTPAAPATTQKHPMPDDTLTSTTRRRAITSPSTDDRQFLLPESDNTIDGEAEADDECEDDGLTLMEQVVLMGIKDRQVQLVHLDELGIPEFYE
jgi:hypothetical protein